MHAKFASSDEYLDSLDSQAFREALIRLRGVLREELPEAKEAISYGIPAFKQEGVLICYAAFKDHCSFFPGAVVEDFESELKGFKVAKGTIRFTPESPIPDELVRMLVRANVSKAKARQ